MVATARSLIIPMYNEVARIASTIEALGSSSLRDLEFILVDDGSTDDTVEVAGAALRREKLNGSVLTRGHSGKGAAVRAGAEAATGEIVAFVDADLSTDVASVLDVLEAAERPDVDIAIGSRRHPSSVIEQSQPWYRTRAGRAFNRNIRRLGLTTRLDTQCGLKAFTSRAAAVALVTSTIDGFAFDVEVLLLAEQSGLQIVEVPVHWAHDDGSAVRVTRDLIPVTRDLLRLRFRRAPPTQQR